MRSQPPAAIVPTPASLFPELRGRRVIVGVPGVGFRGDLRADDAVVNGSRTFVPILTEQDYYRAETEQIEVFAPLVPLDRVWVEQIADGLTPTLLTFAALDAPLPAEPKPADLAVSILGKRLVMAVPDGFVRDLRAVSDGYLNAQGLASVRICGEPEWYRWASTGTTPSTSEVGAEALWVE